MKDDHPFYAQRRPIGHLLVLAALLIVGPCGLLGSGRAWAAPRRAKANTRRPAGCFHAVYSWKERQGPMLFVQEIHLYGNGTIRFVAKTGVGSAHEFMAPKDQSFAKQFRQELTKAKTMPVPTPTCGAPRGGTLTITRLHRKTTTIDLFQPANWARYGRLARWLVRKVMGAALPALDADCRPLRTSLRPGARPPTGLPKIRNRNHEEQYLSNYAKATSDEARFQALVRLAWTRNGDPFFRFELLKRYPTRQQSQALIQYHLAELVRSVSNSDLTRRLLRRIGHRSGPEFDFHRAILMAILGDVQGMRRSLAAYDQALGRKVGKSQTTELKRVAAARTTLAANRTTWRAVKTAHARLFAFYWDILYRIGGGNPKTDPPMASLLAAMALHHARQAFFTRGPVVRGPVNLRARRFVLRYYPSLSKTNWLSLPVAYRFDMLLMTGYLRRHPSLYRNTSFSGPSSDEDILDRLIVLHRYREAKRFIRRRAGGIPKREARLDVVAGRAFRRNEAWNLAKAAFTHAASLGASQGWAEFVRTLIQEGRLVEATAQTLQSKWLSSDATMALARSELQSRLGHDDEAAKAALAAIQADGGPAAHRQAGLALAAMGRLSKAAAHFKAAMSDPTVGPLARVDLAEMALAVGRIKQAMQAARGLRASGSRPGCAEAILSVAAAIQHHGKLASLEAERADFHARTNPDDLVCAAQTFLHHQVMFPIAVRLLRRALTRRPNWSVARAMLAEVLVQGGRPRSALSEIEAAIRVRPNYQPYRRLRLAIRQAIHR